MRRLIPKKKAVNRSNMQFKGFHGGFFKPSLLTRTPSYLQTDSEHKTLVAWLNTLIKFNRGPCAHSNGAKAHDFEKNPSSAIHSTHEGLNLLEGEGISANRMPLDPLATDTDSVDGVTGVIPDSNSNHVSTEEATDKRGMMNAAHQFPNQLGPSAVIQERNIELGHDLKTFGDDWINYSPYQYDWDTTAELKEEGKSRCVTSSSLNIHSVALEKEDAMNPMHLLPHLVCSRDNSGVTSALCSKNLFAAPEISSIRVAIEHMNPNTSQPQNPMQLLPHFIHLRDAEGSEQMCCSNSADLVQDARINLSSKANLPWTNKLEGFAECDSNVTQLLTDAKPTSSTRQRPKQSPKTKLQDNRKQPPGCDKLKGNSSIKSNNLNNLGQGSSKCDRWDHLGNSSQLKSSLLSKRSIFCDNSWSRFHGAERGNELGMEREGLIILNAFCSKCPLVDEIYHTTSNEVAVGLMSKRVIGCAKTKATPEQLGSTARKFTSTKNLAPRRRINCVFARISQQMDKPCINMSKWWDEIFLYVIPESKWESLWKRMLNRSNALSVPGANVANSVKMSRSSICPHSKGKSVVCASQSLMLSSQKLNPRWANFACTFKSRQSQ